MSPVQTETHADPTRPAEPTPSRATAQPPAKTPLFQLYVELFESRATQVACLIGVALFLAPGIDSVIGIPGWAAGIAILACTLSLTILTHEPPPERMIAERTTTAFAGNSDRTHERVLRRKDFFPLLSSAIDRSQSQGSLYTMVVAGLKPGETTTALNEIYELRLECLLAGHFRDEEVPIGRLGGCGYAIGLEGVSEIERDALIDDLRRELADMFSGRARPYVGTAVVGASDDAKSTYERALQSRRTLTTNPFMRLVYWATKA